MPLTHTLATRIADVDPQAWDALREGPDDIFMDRRWLAAVEQGLPAAVRGCRYLLIFDGARPLLSACLLLVQHDAALLGQGWLRSLVQQARRLRPGWLMLPMLQLGSPVSCGQSQLRLAPDAPPELLERLHRLLEEQAAALDAALIVCSEFDDADADRLNALQSWGWTCGRSLPMNRFERAGRYECVDAFAQALRSHYRYKLQRSRRKFAGSGLQVQTLQGSAALAVYTPQVHALYLRVAARAQIAIEPLPHAFFVALLQALPQQVALHLVCDGDEVLAFAWSLFGAGWCANTFIGYDALRPDEVDLYFNLMLLQLDFALARGAGRIVLGQTADDFKSRIGCVPEDRWLFVRPRRSDLRLALGLLGRWLFPPPPAASPRHLWRDERPPE